VQIIEANGSVHSGRYPLGLDARSEPYDPLMALYFPLVALANWSQDGSRVIYVDSQQQIVELTSNGEYQVIGQLAKPPERSASKVLWEPSGNRALIVVSAREAWVIRP
jgi:hypothetical protein